MVTITIDSHILSESQAIKALTRVGFDSDATAFIKGLPYSLSFGTPTPLYRLFRHWRSTGEFVAKLPPKPARRIKKKRVVSKPRAVVRRAKPARPLTRQEARLLNPGDKVLSKTGIPMTYIRRGEGYYWCMRPNKSIDFKATLYAAN